MTAPNDSFDDLLPGKFFKADDVRNGPMTVTIKGYVPGTLRNTKTNAEENAVFIEFEDTTRRLVVKPNTTEALKEIFPGGRSTSIGQPVEMYFDGTVKDSTGKKVGGLRLRKPTGTAASPF